MENTGGERRVIASLGGLTERDLYVAIEKGQIAKEYLDNLTPFFNELIKIIHDKWESLPLDDGANAKALKFQLRAVRELQRLIKLQIHDGKNAAAKKGD